LAPVSRRTTLLALSLPAALFAVTLLASTPARAQMMTAPERSDGWDTATNIMALSSAGLQLVMPRVFYSDPEVTVGWKARWHVSVLAPSMTLATLALLNEQYLKDDFEGFRPGCDETNQGLIEECSSFGMLSTQSFLAFSALGQGTGVFLVDTIKWSGGRFNAGAFAGQVGIPLVLAVLTAVGRTAGEWETGGQAWASGGIGLLSGLGLGALYAALQRPECGYTGGLICW
jgi:hypothetical protein